MWLRRDAKLYVHMEYEMPDSFCAKGKNNMIGMAYQLIDPELSLWDFVQYVKKLARFPVIMLRLRVTSLQTNNAWMVFHFKDCEQLEQVCKQIT